MKQTLFMSFSLGGGSVSDHFVSLANELSSSYLVVVFTDRTEAKEQLNTEVILKTWPSQRPTHFRDFHFLYRQIKAYRPSLTVSLFGSVNIFMVMGFLMRIPHRFAWIRTLSTQFPQKKVLVLRKKYIYKLSTGIITNSEATKADAAVTYGIPLSKIKVLPNAVKAYPNLNQVLPEGVKNIVYVGRLHPSKGVATLISAFEKLHAQHPDIHLQIIGSGPELQNLEKQVTTGNVTPAVTFKGNLYKTEVLKHFAAAYCAVIPSLSEAFGYTTIEAMSVKTCVVGANNTGIKEVIMDQVTGLLFETADATDLFEKLNFLLNNTTVRNDLAANGYLRFLKVYENTIAVQRDFNFFKNVIQHVK